MKNLLILISLLFVNLTLFANETPKIGICFDDSVALRWNVEKHYLKIKIEEYGGTPIFRFAAGNPDIQSQQIKELIDEKVSVLIIVANDAEKVAPLVDEAYKKGIKVIAYDRLIPNCHLEYYISFDNTEIGKMMANESIKLQPKGNYIILGGPKKDHNSILLHQGYLEVLTPQINNGNIKIVLDQHVKEWINIEAFTVVLEHLQEDPNVDAIIASNDNLGLGAREAVDLMMLNDPVIISGQDAEISALERIEQDQQSFTIYKPIKNLAKICGELAMEIATGHKVIHNRKLQTLHNGTYDVETLYLESIIVDKTNVQKIKKEVKSFSNY